MTAPDPAAVASVGAEAVEAAADLRARHFAVDVDTLPPTQYLVMEVLAARYRLGETCWTFPTRLNATIMALGEAGLVWDVGGNVPQTTRVMLTDAGKRAALLANYEPPAHKHLRAQVLAEVDAALRDEHRTYAWAADLDFYPEFATGYTMAADYLRDTLAGDGGEAQP